MKHHKKQDIYITITGLQHYYGADFLLAGMKLKIRKDPRNKFDRKPRPYYPVWLFLV